MTLEEQLRQVILSRYKSLRAFTSAIDIPYSTLDSALKRKHGIMNAGIEMMLKVFDALDLDIESVPTGQLKTRDSKQRTCTLSDDERTLLENYRKLSHTGRQYILQTMDMAVLSYGGKIVLFPTWKQHHE